MNKTFMPTHSGPFEVSMTHFAFEKNCSKKDALNALYVLAKFDTDVTGLSNDDGTIPIKGWFESVKKETGLSDAECVAETLRSWLNDDSYYLCHNVLEDEIDGKIYISVMATHKD